MVGCAWGGEARWRQGQVIGVSGRNCHPARAVVPVWLMGLGKRLSARCDRGVA
jgi:hypothetical protein